MGKWDNPTYQKLAGGANTAAPTTSSQKQEEEGGGGGGGGGYLEQVMQGPIWGNKDINEATRRTDQLNPGRTIKGAGGRLPSLITDSRPNIGLNGKAGGRPIMPLRVDPNTGAAEYADGTVVDAAGYELPSGSMPTNIPKMGAASNDYIPPAITPASSGSNQPSISNLYSEPQQPVQQQYPSWLQTNGGSPFLPGEMPLWTPSDWVNPSNPTPQEVAPQSLEPGLGTGMGVGNTTGLLASLMANDQRQAFPTNAIDYYADQRRRQQDQIGLTESNLPINETLPSLTTGIPRNILPQMAGALNQNIAQYRMQNMAPGSPQYSDAQALYQASLPQTPLSQMGLTPSRSQNLGGTTIRGAGGLTDQVIQRPYNINAMGNDAGAGNPNTPVAQATTSPGIGSGRDATGKTINPWEQVQDPTTGVVHPRGLSLEEVTNSTAANLTKGFDYRNNPGFKGQTVTMPDGTVLPQIAGYYITNGRYYPIDLNAVSKMFKRIGGGSGGGGREGGGGSGAKGWLANWNIGT